MIETDIKLSNLHNKMNIAFDTAGKNSSLNCPFGVKCQPATTMSSVIEQQQ